MAQKQFEKCDCEIDLSHPLISGGDVSLIIKSRANVGERPLESYRLLKLKSQAECHSCIKFGVLYYCDNPERVRIYEKEHR